MAFMDMFERTEKMQLNEQNVLCAANSYQQKYYLNKRFNRIPKQVQEELQIMCVLYTEDVGGILTLYFDEDGNLMLESSAEENDFFYDEIGSRLKIRQLQQEKTELFEMLELYYKTLSEDTWSE